jgi:hypothetical protein
MAYIGKQPIVGNYQVLDAIVATTTDTYALTKDTVAVFPQTPSNCIVSLNGVIQAPTDSYTISGSDIVFASALTGSDSIDFITVLGDVLSIGTPTDGTVTTAKLVDSSVTTAKLNDGSVSLAKLTATGTQDATTFLRGDNTFASAGITEADTWRLTTSYDGANTIPEFITANLERDDTSSYGSIGTGMTQSSGVFSFPSTGIYYVTFTVSGDCWGDNFLIEIYVTTDNSTYISRSQTMIGDADSRENSGTTSCLVDVTDISNVKLKLSVGGVAGVSGSSVFGSSTVNVTHAQFIRLGNT